MRSRRWTRGAALLAVAAMLSIGLPATVSAQEYSAWRKAGRGLASLTTGFLEIPGRMLDEQRRIGLLPGLGVGFAKGIGALAPRHLVGLYELVSWPFPLPRGYEPLIRPEFPWQYFQAPPPAER
jgi:putative exosortase-associated protein (TIGR04073 family)